MRKYFMAGVATAALVFGVSQAMAQSSTGGAADKAGASGATSSPGLSGGAAGTVDHSKKEGSKTVGQARDQAEPKIAQPSTMGSDQKADQKDLKAGQKKMGAGAADQTKQNAQREPDTMKSKSKTTTGQAHDQMKDEKGTQSPSSGKMGAQPSTNQNNAQAPSSSSSSTTKMGQQPSTTQNNAQGSSSSGTTTGLSSSSATQLTTSRWMIFMISTLSGKSSWPAREARKRAVRGPLHQEVWLGWISGFTVSGSAGVPPEQCSRET